MINTTNHTTRRSVRRATAGFSLIELLVVIALTAVLLGLIFTPLIQSFNFTQQAQATAQAQDAARSTTEQLTRELESAAGVRDTTNNFLDLPLLNKGGRMVIAHAYNAYLDIIPPKASLGTIVDPTIDRNSPTVGPGIQSETGLTPELSGTGVSLPLSAGTTVIRYFPGLRFPVDPRYAPSTPTSDNGTGAYAVPQPYTNRYEGMFVSSADSTYTSYTVKQNLNNTYQLYRVNFQPYIPYATGVVYNGAGTPATGTYVPNTNLLPTTSDGTTPIYDDPDFFRIVSVGDTDYVAGQGDNGKYTTATAEAHNFRVYNWAKIAKDVISTREIDLAGLTRAGGKVVYDSNGNPVNSYEVNGVTPIIRTTVSFAPGLISNDPMAATTINDSSQDYGSTPPSAEGIPYVPTKFAAEFGNWQGTPIVTIAKATTTGTSYLQTGTITSAVGDTLGSPNYSSSQTVVNAGDLLLANLNNDGTLGTPVYDITAGAPITSAGAATLPTYDALMFDENSGVVSFSVPALPPLLVGQTSQTVPPNTYWYYTPGTGGVISLLSNIDTTKYASGPISPLKIVPNAQIVVNSERVVGPDESASIVGSAPTTDLVQYTRVNLADLPPTGIGPNQYLINYQTMTITVDPTYSAGDLQVAYSYQNNIGNANAVDTIRASYYTAAMMRLNMGIRVYGAANGQSQYFALNSQVGVSNSKAN